jgi:uncharacterized membrane protein YwzB
LLVVRVCDFGDYECLQLNLINVMLAIVITYDLSLFFSAELANQRCHRERRFC